MRYKLFGNSGLRVSELSLGTLTFGQEAGFGADKAESERVFRAYVEAGGNFLDTANRYTNGTSETWCGDFMGAERDQFVLATKFSLNMRQGDPNAGGNHRKAIVQSLEASLRRLKTDYVDLYWLHQWDATTPVEEVMRTLDDLVRAGKVLYVGISDTPAWVCSQANTLAALRGWTPFVGLQIEYSLIERTPERELLPMARAFGLAVTPWGAIAGGVLSGKYHTAADPNAPADTLRTKLNVGTERTSERGLRIAAEVQAIAGEIGRSSAQVALAWVRQQGRQVIPILGARTEKQLRDNLGCLEFELEPAHLARLHEVSRIELGFPHDFLALPRIMEQRFGGTQDRIDFQRD
ncbi:MAG TPA: aldo/keto reductase [bacterium]|nr:aldo/keto reductase [bacterium]